MIETKVGLRMKTLLRRPTSAILFLLSCFFPIHPSSAQPTLNESVVATGGASSTTTGIHLQSTVGQQGVGKSLTSTVTDSTDFWWYTAVRFIASAPVTSFTADVTTGAAPLTVRFTDTLLALKLVVDKALN